MQVVSIQEQASSGSGVVDSFLASLPPGIFGEALCDDEVLKFNSTYRTDPGLLTAVSRHEMGHAIGLAHTGRYASHDSDNPAAMSTPDCTGLGGADVRDFIKDTVYSQDDEAALINRLGTASPPSLHANQSWERGFTYWGKTGGTWSHFTAGGADGPDYIRFKPTSESQYVYQTIDAVHKSSGSWSLVVDARFNHRRGVNHGGKAKLDLLVRRLDFSGSCGGFLSGLNEHSRDVLSPTFTVVESTGWKTVDSAWEYDTTLTYTVPSGWEGVEIRVRVKSKVRNNGGAGNLTWLRLDNTRAREL